MLGKSILKFYILTTFASEKMTDEKKIYIKRSKSLFSKRKRNYKDLQKILFT